MHPIQPLGAPRRCLRSRQPTTHPAGIRDPRTTPPGRFAPVAGLAVLLATLVPGCGETNQFAPPPPPAVTVALPVRDTVTVYREFTGRTASYETVELRARVSGLVEAMHFDEGAPVAAGDLLYEIEHQPYQAALDAARAKAANAKAVVDETQFRLDKVKELYVKDSASEQELVFAQAENDRAVAARLAADAAVVQAELDLSYTTITAPIAGRINASNVDAGNLVGLGEPTLLSTIVRWNPLHVFFTVSERDVLDFRRRAIASGELERDDVPVFLRLADGSDYPTVGRIDYVDNRIDPDTGTIRVRAIFANDTELLVPGVFARVRVPSRPQERLLVPEVALQRDLAGYYLLVVNEQNVVERRNVEIGDLLGTARAILSGVADEELIIINGLQRARPGSPVDPTRTTYTPDIPPPPDALPPASTTVPSTTQPAETQPTTQPTSADGRGE